MSNDYINLTIADICSKDLVFYSKENPDDSKNFCEKFGITYLPDMSREFCYEMVNGIFSIRNLDQVATCHPDDKIFDRNTLAKFESQNTDNVLIVVKNNLIIGVVHIVDYNNEIVFCELYRAFFRFERCLKEILKKKGVDDVRMLEYIKEKAERENLKPNSDKTHWQKRLFSLTEGSEDFTADIKKKLSKLGQLQIFFLPELLAVYNRVSNEKIRETGAIINIRNKIAHSVDIIRNDMNEETDHLYDFEGLTVFVNNVLLFNQVHEDVESRVQRLNSTDIHPG